MTRRAEPPERENPAPHQATGSIQRLGSRHSRRTLLSSVTQRPGTVGATQSAFTRPGGRLASAPAPSMRYE